MKRRFIKLLAMGLVTSMIAMSSTSMYVMAEESLTEADAPVEVSTEAPTEAPTQAPTQKPTQAPTTVPPVTTKVLIGDVDQNGAINIVDATEVQKHIVEIVTLSGAKLKAADANGDNTVNIKDVTAIQYYAVGISANAGNCGKNM